MTACLDRLRFRPETAGALVLLLLVLSPSLCMATQAIRREPAPLKAVVFHPPLEAPEARQRMQQQAGAEAGALDKPDPGQSHPTLSTVLDARAAAIRSHLAALAAALPGLPAELRRVIRAPELELERSATRVLLYMSALLVFGIGAEWLFRRITARKYRRLSSRGIATIGDRLRALGMRAIVRLGRVVAFAAGAGGTFLLFDWPPLTREIVLEYLVFFICLRAALAVADLLFAPSGPASDSGESEFRIIPMNDAAARFWMTWSGAFAVWFFVGLATVDLLDSLGLATEHRQIVAYAFGLGLLAITLNIAWRRPHLVGQATLDAEQTEIAARTGRVEPWLLTAYLIMLWAAWVTSALNVFWLGLIAGALLLLVRTSRQAIAHILRPPAAAADDQLQTSIGIVCLERGIRAALVIGAVLLLAQKWQIDLAALTTADTPFVRIVRGVLGALIVVLLANFAWSVAKVAIEQKIAEATAATPSETESARRRARLRTLLPILRTVTLIVLITTATMMALASLGIEIGPLIAGAGVFGLAVGFGAQTLVRDVISGMFYLLDDAFRVGEYIESGNYKGTVESFTLRTVKLRHHRGPLYTVPFGVLGAVKNMSRDWVIDKLTVNVGYGTDLDKVKKLIKQTGRDLAENPEFAPHILESLKMQGVEQFSDYGIQLRMKMTTRPGEQFVIRRAAYSLIKKVFDANGIKFASPTVQVSGDAATPSAAAARHALTLQLARSDTR